MDDPYLAGLLAAKAAAASEAGVTLVVSETTWLEDRLAHPLDSVTVVANLLDNGIRAAAEGAREPRTVEVTLLGDGADLVVHVVDSGDGVPADHVGQVFDHGFTTARAPTSRARDRAGAGPPHRPGARGRRPAGRPRVGRARSGVRGPAGRGADRTRGNLT